LLTATVGGRVSENLVDAGRVADPGHVLPKARLPLKLDKTLPLGVAAGDPTRPVGEWAFWTGIVPEVRIDRANGVFVLTVDEATVSKDLRLLDRKVTSTHGP
jgi:hypothetical protein